MSPWIERVLVGLEGVSGVGALVEGGGGEGVHLMGMAAGWTSD